MLHPPGDSIRVQTGSEESISPEDGGVAGAEICQLYLRDEESSVDRPEKELKGFAKVRLDPGESKVIDLEIEYQDLAYWDQVRKDWYVEAGSFVVLVGASSEDIRLNGEFEAI